MADYTKPTDFPVWAINPDPNAIATPSGAKINSGFINQERPPRQDFNYLHNLIGKWTKYIDTLEQGPFVQTESDGDDFIDPNPNLTNLTYKLKWRIFSGTMCYIYGGIEVVWDGPPTQTALVIQLPVHRGQQLNYDPSGINPFDEYRVPLEVDTFYARFQHYDPTPPLPATPFPIDINAVGGVATGSFLRFNLSIAFPLLEWRSDIT